MTKIISVFNLVLMVGIAKSGCWYFDSNKGERRNMFLYVGVTELLETGDKAFSIVIGPLTFNVGLKK